MNVVTCSTRVAVLVFGLRTMLALFTFISTPEYNVEHLLP